MQRKRSAPSDDDIWVDDHLKQLAEEERILDHFYKHLNNAKRGGFEPTCKTDIIFMRAICVHPRHQPKFNWLPKDTPCCSVSPLCLPGESYVMRYFIENWGIRAKLRLIVRDKFANPEWIMEGVCPFHRREHSKQNWVVKINSKLETEIMCFHAPPGRSYLFWAEPGIPIEGRM